MLVSLKKNCYRRWLTSGADEWLEEMNDYSKINPFDLAGGQVVDEVFLRVKSIAFESFGESSVWCGLEESAWIEFKSTRRLICEFM